MSMLCNGKLSHVNPILKLLITLNHTNMKNYLLLLFNLFVATAVLGQNSSTYYGTWAGGQIKRGDYSTFIGYYSGNKATTSSDYNSFVGTFSGRYIQNGDHNVGLGYTALLNTSNGSYNVGVGSGALATNSTGFGNSAMGYRAANTTTGSYNVAIGYYSFYSHYDPFSSNTGSYNTYIGVRSGEYTRSGSQNTAIGYRAYAKNKSGSYATIVGAYSMYNYNAIGNYNTAMGNRAAYSMTSGGSVTAVGDRALYYNPGGYSNSAFGRNAGQYATGSSCTFIGAWSDVNSSGNRALSNATAIGYNAKVTASNQVRIGNSSVNSIGGQVSWSTLSDGRFKRKIKEDVSGLEFINQLRPVSYNVDENAVRSFLNVEDENQGDEAISKTNKRQTGFIAQEVHKLIDESGYAFNGVVEPEGDDDYYSIRYAEFVVPLVKAVQELSAQVEAQQSQINALLNELQTKSENLEDKTELEENVSPELDLGQNKPNPFSHYTYVDVSIPRETSTASLKIYDLKGNEIKSIDIVKRGATKININSLGLGDGMYLYALITDGSVVASKKMIVSK